MSWPLTPSAILPKPTRKLLLRPVSKFFTLALGLALLNACEPGVQNNGTDPEAGAEAGSGNDATPRERNAVRQNSIDFGLDLLRSDLKAADENLSVSPYSLRNVFSMSLGMARGDTQKEIIDTLHLFADENKNHQSLRDITQRLQSFNRKKGEDDETGEVVISNANRFYMAKGIQAKQSYLDILKKYYKTGLYPIDPSSPDKTRNEINGWVKEKTQSLIPELLPKGMITADTQWVLVNALYLKIAWANEGFAKDRTKNEAFTLVSGKKVKTKMMSKTKVSARFGAGEGFRWADVGLSHPALGFLIVVPDSKQWKKVLPKLSGEAIDRAYETGKTGKLDLWLPKFKLDSGNLILNNTLQKLGMKTPFSPRNADFRGLDDKSEVFLETVVQQCVVAIDEKGIEAAAASAAAAVAKSAGPKKPTSQLRVDRPFLFFIHDRKSGAILFSGRVMDPR